MPPALALHFGPYRLEGPHGPLWHHAELVALPPKALAVLWQLACQAGQVVSKATLLDTVWAETVVSEGTLTTCLSLLRHALGEDAQQPRYIATVHRLGYRFVAPVTPAGPSLSLAPPPALVSLPLTPPPLMVGRAAELAQLHACFAQARQGDRQLVFVTGEAGMGKTTLVDAFLAEVAAAQTAWIGRGQCIEHTGVGEAYLPLLDALGRLGQGPAGARLGACVRQSAPTWLGPLAALLGEEERAGGGPPGHEATPPQMLRELAEALEACTAAHPLLLVLEDLHWSDAATVEALALLARRRDAARVLVLGTYRPVELILRQHPLKAAKQELQLHGHCADVALGYLPVAAVQAYLAQRGPAAAATAERAAWVHQRTEGHPLFMVHVVEELVRSGWRTAAPAPAAAGQGAEMAVPASLRQLIELQLGQLDAEEQQVLEVASVVGAEFAEASVAAGLPLPLDAIAVCCEGLARRGQFIEDRGLAAWPDGTVSGRYGFRHALYQEVLYGRIGSGRRMRCHRAIGTRLEAGYGAQVAQIAATLAVHFERGCDPGRAVQYRHQAAENARRQHAYQEVIGHLTRGLALLQTLPDTPERTQHECDFQLTLALAYGAIAGWGAPETVQAYTQADELSRPGQDPTQRLRVLRGLSGVHTIRGELQQAREMCKAYLRLTKASQEPALLLDGHQHLGQILYWCGDFATAWVHLEQAIALSALPRPQAMLRVSPYDPGVGGRSYAALVLWMLGYPDQALQQSHAALTLAQELSDPFSLAWALHFTAVLHCHRRDVHAVEAWSAQVLALAHEQGFAQRIATGTLLQGWALAAQGQHAEGLARLRQGLAAYRATGAEVGLTYFLALLVDACGTAGHIEEELMVLTESLAWVDQHGERFYEAELCRLKGELLLAHVPANPREAETCFQQALGIARRQHAQSLELRATLSLTRLWQRQGKRDGARALLAPLYGWFTEGFDTTDLQEAKALLEALA